MEVAFPDPATAAGSITDGPDSSSGSSSLTLTAVEAQRATAVLQGMVKKLTLLGTLASTTAPTSSSSSSTRSPSSHVRASCRSIH